MEHGVYWITLIRIIHAVPNVMPCYWNRCNACHIGVFLIMCTIAVHHKRKSIVDNKLRPGAAFWWTQPNALVVAWRPTGTATWRTSEQRRAWFWPIVPRIKTTLSTKPEVHNMATPSEKDRATATGITHKNWMKFGRSVLELCEQTDKQTYSSQDFTPLLGQSNY